MRFNTFLLCYCESYREGYNDEHIYLARREKILTPFEIQARYLTYFWCVL